jgi:hypothetical protein
LEPGSSFRIQVTTQQFAGQHVDLIPNTDSTPFDCIISSVPKVVADMQTIMLMNNQTIDYDYDNEEFIISNRGKQ